MSIEVTARHKDISTELQEYARKKAENIIAEYPKSSTAKAVLDFGRRLYKTHFTVTVNGTQFDSEAEDAENIVKTIDEAADKVSRQIRKQIDKVNESHRN